MANQEGIDVSPQKLRAAVIGCGKMGSGYSFLTDAPGVHSHAQAYKSHASFELVGVSDPDARALKAASEGWGVQGLLDPAQLCQSALPDVVSICSPNETHAVLIKTVLSSCKPRLIFVEKPIATKSADAAEVVRLAEESGCLVLVNYSRRFDPRYEIVKNELPSYGKLLRGQVTYGKGLLHSGSHAIDLLRYWFGEVTSVQADGQKWWGPTPDDPTVGCTLKFSSSSIQFVPFDEQIATVWEIDLFFEKARLRILRGGVDFEFYDLKELPPEMGYSGYKEYLINTRGKTDRLFMASKGSLEVAMDHISDLLSKSPPLSRCSGEDGLRALQVVEEVWKQIK